MLPSKPTSLGTHQVFGFLQRVLHLREAEGRHGDELTHHGNKLVDRTLRGLGLLVLQLLQTCTEMHTCNVISVFPSVPKPLLSVLTASMLFSPDLRTPISFSSSVML